jgi:XTP/dITP diphosphohydrolase
MSRIAEWVLASGSRGKLEEFQSLLAEAGVTLHTQSSLGIEPVAETAPTFVENALAKARHAAAAAAMPAIADDSGLCVDALAGAPGLLSARYAGPQAQDAANVEKLLRALSGVPRTLRSAHFICVIVALERADDPAPIVVSGRWHGWIAEAPRGTNGFGYDPIFMPDQHTLTAAELPPQQKNRCSHRAQALARLREALGK